MSLKNVRRTPRAAALALFLIGLLGIPVAAAPPAGTSIGNQASASYTDASGIPQTATSNVVVTTVLPVYSVDVEQSLAQNAVPASSSSFPLTIENTGNDTDSFDLSVTDNGGGFLCASTALYVDADSNGVPDNATNLDGTTFGPIVAGGISSFVVVCQVPGTALAGDVNTVTVTATSSADGTQSDSVTDTTTVTANAVVVTTKAMSAASGAAGTGPYTVTLTYTNNGNNTATDVTLTDVLDVGFEYVNGSAAWSDDPGLTPTEASDGLEGTAPDQIDYQVSPIPPVAGPYTVTAVISQVLPGQSGSLSFDVNVAAAATPGGVTNQADLTYDDDGSGATPPIAGQSNIVPFTILPTAGVTIATPPPIASATPGSTISFTNTVTNTGNAPDIFDIEVDPASSNNYPAGTSFFLFQSDGLTPLLDTGGNPALSDTGTLAAGATYDVILRVVLPAGIPGVAGPYSVDKTATSSLDPGVDDTATDTLTTIVAASMDLTNTGDPDLVGVPDGTGAGPEASAIAVASGDPGTVVDFILVANNTSGVPDTYDLSAIVLPVGWTAAFRDAGASLITNTGAVPAGGSVQVTAEVTIPAGWPGTDPLAATPYEAVQFQAASPTTGALDVILDGVFVNSLRNVSITPDNTGQVFPGGSVIYTHTLANNGNVIEATGTITLSTAESDATWGTQLFVDTVANGVLDGGDTPITGPGDIPSLAPGGSVTILARVTAPPGAAAANTTTITATTVGSINGVAAPAPSTATDTTSVVSGNLTLLKEQAIDAACDGTADTGFGVGNISAAPAECVIYRLTATNAGIVDITSLVINDSTPANTTQSALTTLTPLASGNITQPGIGATGTVSVDVGAVGALTPAASVIVEFGVQIDP